MSNEARGRVLCVTSSFPRWAGDSTAPFVHHLAQDLQALGWSVDVLAPHAPGAAVKEVMGGVGVERFRYLWPEALQTLCYQGGALAKLRENPLNKFKLPSFVLCEWASVFRRLGRGRYDLLHSHWVLPQGFIGALAAGPRKIPHVVSVHGSDVFALKGSILDRCKRFALRAADIVTVNSSATRQATERLLPGIPDLRSVPFGVSAARAPDASQVSALRRRYRREPGPLLVFLGRVVFEKGVEDLISAVGILAPKMPGVTALIVGDGPDRPALEAAVGKLGLNDKIFFSGWAAPDEVPAYMAAADLFVGPSWFEGQGLVFAEAMLAETPVIATDVGGVGDTVRHEVTGLLVRDRAPGQIAAAVERLTRDPALASRLVAAGKAQVRAHGLRAHTAAAFSDLFQNVLAGRAAPCPQLERPQRQEVS